DILAKFQECGALLIDDAETIDRIRNVLFSTGVLNRAIVGKTPEELAPYFDIEVQAGTKVLLVKGSEPGAGDMMNKEILCPMIRFFTYEKFEDAVAGAAANLYVEGAGHSACLWSRDKEHIEYAGMKLPTCRLLVEQTGAGAAGNTPNNGLNPTLSISCGSWGGNALSENLSYYHFLNMTRISYNLPDRAPLDMAEWNA
ncbi:MAG: succinate-semialdehyde dehydrogenase, partial [Firmicutes bacterium]|nr:succinate-semialdehyde dehydrogenase [Bacillota bacterium]